MVAVTAGGLLIVAAFGFAAFLGRDWTSPFPDADERGRIPLAVLGDSNSHSYQDTQLLTKAGQRGGEWRAKTWQWTDILNQLRGRQIDQGELGVWGTQIKPAEAMDWIRERIGVGPGGRAPKKRDYRFNFAVSGAVCEDLGQGYYRQTQRLLALMARSPERWRDGIVVIHIGVNSIGQPPELERYANAPLTPALRAQLDRCVQSVSEAAEQIRAAHPQTRLVLISMLTGIHEPGAIKRWTSRSEIERIEAATAIFNDGLRKLAAQDKRAMYFDQDAWIKAIWGGRDENGQPAYRTAKLMDGREISLTIGDAPQHAVLGDEHAGTAWNAWWVQALVAQLNSSFGLEIPPLSAAEIASLIPTKK